MTDKQKSKPAKKAPVELQESEIDKVAGAGAKTSIYDAPGVKVYD